MFGMCVLAGVYLGSDIGTWHWVGNCIYSWYTT